MVELSKNDSVETFLETAYSQYKSFLLRIIKKYLGANDSCEDVFQEVFIKIIRNSEYLISLPKPKFEAYIALIARGTSIDYLRKAHRDIPMDMSNDIILTVLNKTASKPAPINNPFLKVDLALLMEKVPAEDQILLIGKYYLGLSIEDLALIIGNTATSVKSRLHRARKRLLEEWTQSNLNLGDFVDE